MPDRFKRPRNGALGALILVLVNDDAAGLLPRSVHTRAWRRAGIDRRRVVVVAHVYRYAHAANTRPDRTRCRGVEMRAVGLHVALARPDGGVRAFVHCEVALVGRAIVVVRALHISVTAAGHGLQRTLLRGHVAVWASTEQSRCGAFGGCCAARWNCSVCACLCCQYACIDCAREPVIALRVAGAAIWHRSGRTFICRRVAVIVGACYGSSHLAVGVSIAAMIDERVHALIGRDIAAVLCAL